MSGTSLDGVDAVLVELGTSFKLLGSAHSAFPEDLRATLLQLNTPGENELDIAGEVSVALSRRYADVVKILLAPPPSALPISAIGCHGQTVRHRPERGYTIQLGNPALLAELTGIAVVADFRSRDIAAGGQGAPLVPAFHAALFRHPSIHRVIVNIGGIANLTDLPPTGMVTGFDCGPGNVLLDGWISKILGNTYDAGGSWSLAGKCVPALLDQLLSEPYFSSPPPKSTGRELFNIDWLLSYLSKNYRPEDVQATLVDLTAIGITDAIRTYCSGAQEIYVCGGGANNGALVDRLTGLLPNTLWQTTNNLNIAPDCVEAAAFAWLAQQTLHTTPGNLTDVTGAKGPRILGAIYPA